MKRILISIIALLSTALLLAGFDSNAADMPVKKAGSGNNTAMNTDPNHSPANTKHVRKMVGKTELFLHETKTYNPKDFRKTSMNGEPSDIHFFKPEKDEGIRDRNYPNYDGKTFKFLVLPGNTISPQDYYMFDKRLLSNALKGTGYTAKEILDSGHIKILPNLYLGYYDFAYVPLNVLTEYWSGNESMNQELWRDGNDYVVIGNSYNGGTALLVPPNINDIKQLAGQKVGIMNPSYNVETLLNKKLNSIGLATESAGGNVKVEMGNPAFVMNDLIDKKIKAVFAWGMYEKDMRKLGYKELISWKDMGYGDKVPYNVLVVRRDILQKHPDIVQKVVQANYDSTQMAIKDGKYVKPLVKKFDHYWSYYMGKTNLKLEDIRTSDLFSIDYKVNPNFYKDVWDYMSKNGYFKKPYKFTDLVNTTFQDKINK